MPLYELRLYRRLDAPNVLHRVVDQYVLEAEDDASATALAKDTSIPTIDESDYAILFGPNGHQLWKWEV